MPAQDSRAIGLRLRRIRQDAGMTQSGFAEALGGCSQGLISAIEVGSSAPSALFLSALEHLNYSASWLLTGQGSMKSTKSTSSTSDPSEFAARDRPASVRYLPILGRVPAGKHGVSPVYEESEGTFPFPAGVLDDPEAFCLRVEGDSMAGVVENGDLVVVSPSRRARFKDNDLVVVRIEPEATLVKRVMHSDGCLVLLSSNPSYPPIIVQAETVTLIGKVLYTIHHYK